MKKIFLVLCILLSVFATYVYAEDQIDRSLWWSSKEDDPGLRIAQAAPQQNKKSFSNTQPVKTTTQTTNLRANPSSDFLYEFRDDNTNALKIIKYKGTSSTIVIPESIEGISVTAITELDLNERLCP